MSVYRPSSHKRRSHAEPGGLESAEFLHHEVRRLRQELVSYLHRTHLELMPEVTIKCAQSLVDQTLLVLFAEARGLLAPGSLEQACNTRDGEGAAYWAVLSLFNKLILTGAPVPVEPRLSELRIPNEVCLALLRLAAFDYRKEVSVEMLGHLLEQSNADLEELLARLSGHLGMEPGPKKKRRREGGFHCPPRLTGFLVRESLGRAFLELWAETQEIEHQARRLRKYQDKLLTLRVLDPACGSGAFLMGSLEAIAREQKRVRLSLTELGEAEAPPSDPTEHLFGLDTAEDTVTLCRLSLWLKMAERRILPSRLDRNIRRGNSIISDTELDPSAVDWTSDPIFSQGFDIVLSNPPFVRQDIAPAYKEHWSKHFKSYDSNAELFVYYMERGLSALKPGGRLAFMVPGKWFRAGFAEGLRDLIGRECTVDTLIDFGNAPIFPEAETSPSMIILRKQKPALEHKIRVSVVPREQTARESVAHHIENQGFVLPQAKLSASGWLLDRPDALSLMERIEQNAVPLSKFIVQKAHQGMKSGPPEAFLVDSLTRERLVQQDPSSAELFKRYLRPQDILRWSPSWGGYWMIMLRSSGDAVWPWSDVRHERAAEFLFAKAYPALHAHLQLREKELRERAEQGKFYWELRPGIPLDLLSQPKILWKETTYLSDFCMDASGYCISDSVFFLPAGDPWILACMNSPAIWSWLWRHALHGRDDSLKLKSVAMESLPIAKPIDDVMRAQVAHMVAKLSDPSLRLDRSDLMMLERRTAGLIHQAYGLTPDDEALLWETAPPRMPLLDWSGGGGAGVRAPYGP